jgi:hypothetical protein
VIWAFTANSQIPSWHNICPNCNLSNTWDVIHLIPTACILWNILLSAWDIRQRTLVVVYWKVYWFVFVLFIAYRTLIRHYTLSICIHTLWVNDYCNVCCILSFKCRNLNWSVQCDFGHYTNFLSHLLVASKVQTEVCSLHFEKPCCNCREYDGIVVTSCIWW